MAFSTLSTIQSYSKNVYKKPFVIPFVDVNDPNYIPNRILHYDFEGSKVTDKFYNNCDGSNVNNSITTLRKKYGLYAMETSFLFNPLRYVQLPDNIPIVLSQGLSISMWIFNAGSSTGGDNIVFELDHNNGVYLVNFAGTANYSFTGSTNFNVAQQIWTHLALTVNSSNQVNIYKNGNAVILNQTVSVGLYPTTNFLLYGKIGRSISSAHKGHTGGVDDFKIYNKILTSAEVVKLFNNTAI